MVHRIALVLAFLGACRYGFDEQATAVTDADLASPDGSERCPRGRGPDMSLVPGGFCIDNTEVTKAQYDAFLGAAVPVDTSGRCAYKTTHDLIAYVNVATTDPGQAAAGMDWCDARDFCAWAGKRLCGRIGGGSLAYTEHAIAGAQWYAACSRNAGLLHPYGSAGDDAAKPGYCHLDDANNATGRQSVVGTFPQCKLVGAPVFDLLGNLQEYIDACEVGASDPASDRCKTMGGLWYFASSYSDCEFWDPAGGGGVMRGAREKHIGFRCCAD